MARNGGRRLRPWPILVAATSLGAGLLFATSATTAKGTDLRSGRRVRLAELIDTEAAQVAALDVRVRELRDAVESGTAAAAQRDGRVMADQDRARPLLDAVGLRAVRGPGLEVRLDDAPRLEPGEERPGDPAPDDLVVHEQDVLAVINALWAGGAEAIGVMGDRIMATSAVRCVGNTLLLHGAVYSPPFVLRAIGDSARMSAALDESPGVQLFRSYVSAYDLGYEAHSMRDLRLPPYDGGLTLPSSKVAVD